MKKVLGCLFLLVALALLDGTPIHDHHGKFISLRNKTSVHESFDSGIQNYGLAVIADDDENISVSVSDFHPLVSIAAWHGDRKITTTFRNLLPATPLYKLGCNFRI